MNPYMLQEPYLNPRAAVIETDLGFGIHSVDQIQRLELVAVFGGKIISGAELVLLSDEEKRMTLQVDEDRFSFSVERHPTDYINHSCDPNLGFNADGNLCAMQDIEPGLPLVFDYSMADSTEFDEFQCLCASIFCRGSVTGEDWKIPDLQERYRGWFMPYLQTKIASQNPGSVKS
jgi:hypothetical protein